MTFDTMTGPGVLLLGPEVRLKPLIPNTPRGIPALIGFCSGKAPVDLALPTALPGLLPGLASVYTGKPAGIVAMLMLFVLMFDVPRPVDPPPIGAAEFGPAVIVDGGSIWSGSSTFDLRGAGGESA